MPRIGYARVSNLDQDLDGQVARLKAEGCAIIRSEKVSGGSRDGRPELATVLEFLSKRQKGVVRKDVGVAGLLVGENHRHAGLFGGNNERAELLTERVHRRFALFLNV